MALSQQEIQEAIRKLELFTHELVNSNLVGGYKSAFKGKGLEFEGFREYTSSDDAALIDWKASARSEKTIIREFAEERNLTVFFLLDSSATMDFGTSGKTKYEYAAQMVAALSYAVLNVGDSAGLGIYSDGIREQMLPTSGVSQYYHMLNRISSSPLGSKSNLKRALEQILLSIPRGSFIIIVSDFLGVGTEWKDELAICARKFDVVGLCVRDERDMRFPEGVGEVLLADPYSERKVAIDVDAVKPAFEREAAAQLSYVKRSFEQSGADFLYLETGGSFVDPLIQFFIRRNARR
ncbi:DUF58 domain-containing protein [Candidatus Micrarchaeota archaeon]|nr:DUF58 domain-containing protein [Candidatus Micrarchaeota archaeon]MBI5176777.1 DUF58 domain-containing protein [Candidatus Micrarchaeota archaeon]